MVMTMAKGVIMATTIYGGDANDEIDVSKLTNSYF